MKISINKKGKRNIILISAVAAVVSGFIIQRTESPEIYYDGSEFRENISISEITADEAVINPAEADRYTAGADKSENPHTIPDTNAETAAVKNTDNSIPDKTSDEENGMININTASAEELQLLEGIGEKLSQRIVDYRTQNGNFNTIEDIMKVSGIGRKTFENFKDKISV